MKKKIYTTIGLMSGTSMDGVDISMIKSDGNNQIEQISDKYYEFEVDLYKELISLRETLRNLNDLDNELDKINKIEKKFTLFTSQIINKFIYEIGHKPDLIGFHGQTIFHDVQNKISKQIGDGKLLSQLTKSPVINKFRQNDLDNNGQGAPLTPVFHFEISKKLCKENKLSYPINIINIGGITNVTSIKSNNDIEKDVSAYDIGPGNCLIDEWLRKTSDVKFDKDGEIAVTGKLNQLTLSQAIENFEISSIQKSLDVKDFDISFAKGLSVEDGCTTITEFTAYLISEGLKKIDEINNMKTNNLIFCGGGRKNKSLIDKIFKFMNNKKLNIMNIDKFQINGDFIESQAFAYLAIRSYLNLPISFPMTTRCDKASSGGVLIKNF